MVEIEGIPVTIQDRFGDVANLISLQDLIRTGDNYIIHLINGGKMGSTSYELVIDHDDQLAQKIHLANNLVTT